VHKFTSVIYLFVSCVMCVMTVDRLCHEWEMSMSGVTQREQVLNNMLNECLLFNDKLNQLEKWVIRMLEACDRQDMGHDVASIEDKIEKAKVSPFFYSFNMLLNDRMNE